MADRFDVVVVVGIRIEDEGPIVARMVLGPKPRTSVLSPARRYRLLVEGLNSSALCGSERDVEGLAWGSPWAIQKSGLPRLPNPAAEALGSMISS
jgi:hypothetical protein